MIPEGVTFIGDSAFENCRNLLSVTLPETLTDIGSNAFLGCDNLSAVHIPSLDAWCSISFGNVAASPVISGCIPYVNGSVVSDLLIPEGISAIRDYAFSNWNSLQSVRATEGLLSIGAEAFSNCGNLKSIILPNSLSSIKFGTFSYCSNLESIALPDSVLTIESKAFSHCENLKSIDLPSDLIQLGQNVFEGCCSLESIDIPNGVDALGSNLFKDCTSLAFVKLPDNLVLIREYAFANCQSLSAITIPENLNVISPYAFSKCAGLETLYVPEGVTRIEEGAFSDCSNLKRITIPESLVSIGRYAFSGCELVSEVHIKDIASWCNISFVSGDSNPISQQSLLYVDGKGIMDLVIPEGVIAIPDYAFLDYARLASVSFPASLSSIGEHAFSTCKQLKVLVLPDRIDTIGYSAFSTCTQLESISLPKNLAVIKSNAFGDCYALTSIVLPENLNVIETMAFFNCKSLTSVTLPKNLSQIMDGAFEWCTNLYVVFNNSNLPLSSGSEFGCVAKYAKIIVNADGEYIVCNDSEKYLLTPDDFLVLLEENEYILLAYVGNATTITLPESIFGHIYKIRDFRGANYVTLPEELNKLSENAFQGCIALKAVSCPESMISIGSAAFGGCSNLSKIVMPKQLEVIGSSAFWGCEKVTSFVIPEKLSIVDAAAFSGCENLAEVHIPSLYTWCNISFATSDSSPLIYGAELLLNNLPITDLSIPEGITSINSYAFQGCSSIVSVSMPESVTVIKDSAFYGCQNLKSILFSKNITTICQFAFCDCISLETINLPEKLSEISEFSFAGCTGLFNNPEYYDAGTLVIDGWLLYIDPEVRYLPNASAIEKIASDVYRPHLKTAVFGPGSNSFSFHNLHTLIVKRNEERNLLEFFSGNIPITLQYIVLDSSLVLSDVCSQIPFFESVSGVTIYVDNFEDDLRWDDNFPGWNGTCKVYYKGEWSWVHFYDESGNILCSEPTLNSSIIRRPYYDLPSDEHTEYIFLGWDLNDDGVPDAIPATTADNILAKAVVEKRVKRYTVTFRDSQTGEIYLQEALPYGAAIQPPAEPRKDGFVFKGWLDFSEGMTVTGELIFETNWHQHTHQAKVTPSTCTEQGYTTYTCHCGESYVDNYVEPTGHTWSDWTDGAPGREERTCRVCGEVESREKAVDYDVDGDGAGTEGDAQLLLSILVGNTESEVLFDFDFDGVLTIYDCVLLMQQIG